MRVRLLFCFFGAGILYFVYVRNVAGAPCVSFVILYNVGASRELPIYCVYIGCDDVRDGE